MDGEINMKLLENLLKHAALIVEVQNKTIVSTAPIDIAEQSRPDFVRGGQAAPRGCGGLFFNLAIFI